MYRFLTDENEININNGVDFTDAIIEWYDRQGFNKPMVFSPHIGSSTVVLICDSEELKETSLAAVCDADTYNRYGLGERKYKVQRGGTHNQNIIGQYVGE